LTLGFDTVKDLLDVLIIPVVIFIVGALLPGFFEAIKTRKFMALIRRELGEMVPEPLLPEGIEWHRHLVKRFIHEEIFDRVSENRDFILSLPPDIAYNAKQLWTHYKKAQESESESDLAEHGAAWCNYLDGLCTYFDDRENKFFFRNREKKSFLETVYKPWEELILAKHPKLQGNRLPVKKIPSKKSGSYEFIVTGKELDYEQKSQVNSSGE
jgi:hypothetical protein